MQYAQDYDKRFRSASATSYDDKVSKGWLYCARGSSLSEELRFSGVPAFADHTSITGSGGTEGYVCDYAYSLYVGGNGGAS